MAGSAFGSDVLFKMVSISSAAVSCTNEEKDLSPYAVVIGGEAKIGTASESAKSLVVVQSGSSYVRLDGGYLHVTLPRALKAGDKIYFTTYNNETKTLYLTNSATRARWGGTSPYDNEISPATDFEVNSTFATSAGRMNNSKELYFHYGASNAPYIKSLVITSDEDANVKDYLFDGLDAVTYSEATTDIFGGDIVVHSTGGSKIQALYGTNVFYTNGAGKGRELEVKVSGPCDIDVYAISPTGNVTGRKLHLSDNNSNNSALIKEGTDIITIDAANLAKVAKGSSEYNSFAPRSLYISTSTGAWNIAAIRVTYKSSDVHVITANNCTMSGGGSSDGIIWTSTTGNNITFANESPSTTNPISKTTDGANFTIVSGKGLRLAGGKTYTVSVPSNQVIVAAYVEAYSHGDKINAKINVNDAGMSAELPNHTSGSAPTKIYSAVNASSFTIVTNSTNSLVEIKLLTEELGYYPVTVSHGWASFCAAEDVEIPTGLTAYVGESVSAGELALTEIEGSKIPANTGVVLAGADGDYEMVSTSGAAALSSSFTGTVKRIANPDAETTYTLWYDSSAGEVVLAKYTGSYIPANRAYLTHSGSVGAPLRMVVRHNTPTGVESTQLSAISSQKVIENGQLVIIREGVRYNVVGQIIK